MKARDEAFRSWTSSFVLFRPRQHQKLLEVGEDLGADLVDECNALEKIATSTTPRAVLLSARDIPFISSLIGGMNSESGVRFLVIGSTEDLQNHGADVAHLLQSGRASAWIEHKESASQIKIALCSALNEAQEQRQNRTFMELVTAHNRDLEQISNDLEERVELRRQALKEESERLDLARRRTDLIQRAIILVQQSRSTPEMESRLLTTLSQEFHLTALRISFRGQSSIATTLGQRQSENWTVYTSELTIDRETVGQMHFVRNSIRNFSRDEKAFLDQLAEATTLAIHRIEKWREYEEAKAAWEATFNAIDDPLVLLDQYFLIVRANVGAKRFAQTSGRTGADSDLCHHYLFGLSSPCPGCTLLGDKSPRPSEQFSFSIRCDDRLEYDVFTEHLASGPLKGFRVHMYRDVTEVRKLESRLVESAQLSELGTIGSSIAHQLNNPLAAMLSYIQLLRMDTPPNAPWMQDIHAMEQGALRCGQIVRELLGFTRHPSGSESEVFEIHEILGQAIRLAELETRSKGVRFSINQTFQDPLRVAGNFNLIVQALRMVLLTLAAPFQSDAFTNQLTTPLEIETAAEGQRVLLKFSSPQEFSPTGLAIPDDFSDLLTEASAHWDEAARILSFKVAV